MNILLNIFAVIGFISAIVTIMQFIFPDFREYLIKKFSNTRKIRYEQKWDMKKINDLIEKSQNVMILQTWIPSLNLDISSWEKASNNTIFKILLINKSLVESRIKCREHDTDNIENNIKRLKSCNKKTLNLKNMTLYLLDQYI